MQAVKTEGDRPNTPGFTLPEVIVVVTIISIIVAIGVPTLVSYWRAARLSAGASEVRTLLNVARQEAIRRNDSVCVEYLGLRFRLRQTNCGGTALTLPGTDGNGWFTLANDIEVSGTTANVVFSYLGGVATPGQYTVRDRTGTAQTTTVTVLTSGRVTIP